MKEIVRNLDILENMANFMEMEINIILESCHGNKMFHIGLTEFPVTFIVKEGLHTLTDVKTFPPSCDFLLHHGATSKQHRHPTVQHESC